jgi:hypothetical protein
MGWNRMTVYKYLDMDCPIVIRQIGLKMILNDSFENHYLEFMIGDIIEDDDYETDEGCDIVYFEDSSDEEN